MDFGNVKAGDLNRPITMRKWREAPDYDVSVEDVYDAGMKLMAAHLPVGLATMQGSVQIGERVTDRFVVRFRAGVIESHLVTKNHVIDKGPVRYRVRGASPMNGGREFVVIDVEMLEVINA